MGTDGHRWTQMDTDYQEFEVSLSTPWCDLSMQFINHEGHEEPPASPKAQPMAGRQAFIVDNKY